MLVRLTRAAALLLVAAIAGGATTARAQVAVVSSTVQEHAAAPGESYVGTIRVLNTTAQSQTVRVYQTDYDFAADGTSRFDAPGSTPRSNARWVTPSATQLVLPPNANVAITYAVIVPRGDSIAGTYWSTVMVEALFLARAKPSSMATPSARRAARKRSRESPNWVASK